MKPSARQLEAFILRCTGLKYEQVGRQMGIGEKSALLAAHAAAARLILAEPSPGNAANRTLAFHYFPKIAAKHKRTLEPTS